MNRLPVDWESMPDLGIAHDTDIALRVGCSRATVRFHRVRLGRPVPQHRRRVCGSRRPRVVLDLDILSAVVDGEATRPSTLSEALGLPYSTAYSRLIRLYEADLVRPVVVRGDEANYWRPTERGVQEATWHAT